MTRVNRTTLKFWVAELNRITGQKDEPYTRGNDGTIKSNSGVFVLDIAYGGYRLSRISGETGGESSISPRLSARGCLDYISAVIYGYELATKNKGV